MREKGGMREGSLSGRREGCEERDHCEGEGRGAMRGITVREKGGVR